MTDRRDAGAPGTTDQKPRWEGPPENRPRGYLPANDDPAVDRDAAGETLSDPSNSDLPAALSTREGAAANDDDDMALILAERTDLSPLQARDLIRQHGHDRATLLREARNFKAES